MALKASVFGTKTPPKMQNLIRYELDDQRRFPLKVVNVLSQEFSSHGLQFFKRKKSVTHVSVSRPHHLNLEQTPVSDSIRDIVTFVVENRDCTRRMILDKFAPEPDKQESAEAPPEGDAPEAEPPLSPERTAVLSDLHWLVHQGHVVEYANGQMEIAPKPQPPQPKKKKPKADKKPKAEVPTATEATADAPAAAETKPAETPEPSTAEPPASETSDTTKPPEPDQALDQADAPTELADPTQPAKLAEPTEADTAAAEPPAADEGPAQDDSPAPAKAAE